MLVLVIVFTTCACGGGKKAVSGEWYEENGYLKLDIDDELVLQDFVWSLDEPIEVNFDYKVSANTLTIIGNNGDKVPLEIVCDDNKEPTEPHYIYKKDKDSKYEIVLRKEEVELVEVGTSVYTVMKLLDDASKGIKKDLTDEETQMVIDYNNKINNGYRAIEHLIKTLDFEWTGSRSYE